jgi:hypothetical protein
MDVAYEPLDLLLAPLEARHRAALLGGRKVDMVNPRYLNRRLRGHVLREAEVQYAEG